MEESATRASFKRTITIFAHYEWPPFGSGPVLQQEVEVHVFDSTCWVPSLLPFAQPAHVLGTRDGENQASCIRLRRSKADCAHIALENATCLEYRYLCGKGDAPGPCAATQVLARYPSCGERTSCLQLTFACYRYLSGQYCHQTAESVGPGQNGQTFLKEGRTVQESFRLVANDGTGTEACADKNWLLRRPDPKRDFYNETARYVEFKGDIVACFDAMDLVAEVFRGQGSASSSVHVVGDDPTSFSATVQVPSCGAPNLTQAQTIQLPEEEGLPGVEQLILDNPAAFLEDDHWLHPCQCVPPSWGNDAPVSREAIVDVPAGSGNRFQPAPFLIATGALVCEQKYLRNIFVLETAEDANLESCQVRCAQDLDCRFFFSGSIGQGNSQCWTYSACETLHRQMGISGSLNAWPKLASVCRISDADLCWHVSKRREFLRASLPVSFYIPSCLHQPLFVQCDQKLMLRSSSVESCGQCKYVQVALQSTGFFPQDQQPVAMSADDRYPGTRIYEWGPNTTDSPPGRTLNINDATSARWGEDRGFLYSSNRCYWIWFHKQLRLRLGHSEAPMKLVEGIARHLGLKSSNRSCALLKMHLITNIPPLMLLVRRGLQLFVTSRTC